MDAAKEMKIRQKAVEKGEDPEAAVQQALVDMEKSVAAEANSKKGGGLFSGFFGGGKKDTSAESEEEDEPMPEPEPKAKTKETKKNPRGSVYGLFGMGGASNKDEGEDEDGDVAKSKPTQISEEGEGEGIDGGDTADTVESEKRGFLSRINPFGSYTLSKKEEAVEDTSGATATRDKRSDSNSSADSSQSQSDETGSCSGSDNGNGNNSGQGSETDAAALSHMLGMLKQSELNNLPTNQAEESGLASSEAQLQMLTLQLRADAAEQGGESWESKAEAASAPAPAAPAASSRAAGAWVSASSRLQSRMASRAVSRRPSGDKLELLGGQSRAEFANALDGALSSEADRIERQRAWAVWFKEKVPDISVAQAQTYIDILWKAKVTTPSRLNKRLLKKSGALLELGFDDDDAEDIATALTCADSEAVGSQSPTKASAEAADVEAEATEAPHAPLESPASVAPAAPAAAAAIPEETVEEEEEQEEEEAEAEEDSVALRYMPPDADNYVNMVTVSSAGRRNLGGRSICGLVVCMLAEEAPSLWVYGKVDSLSIFTSHCYRVSLPDGEDFDLNLQQLIGLKVELCESTLRHVVSGGAPTEKMNRSLFYPELGSLPTKGAGLSTHTLERRAAKLASLKSNLASELDAVKERLYVLLEEEDIAEKDRAAHEMHLMRQAQQEKAAAEEAERLAIEQERAVLAAAAAEERRLRSEQDMLAHLARDKELKQSKEAARQREYEEQRAKVFGQNKLRPTHVEGRITGTGADDGDEPKRAFSLRRTEPKHVEASSTTAPWANKLRPARVESNGTDTDNVEAEAVNPPPALVSPFSRGRRLSMPLDPNAPPPPAALSPYEKKVMSEPEPEPESPAAPPAPAALPRPPAPPRPPVPKPQAPAP